MTGNLTSGFALTKAEKLSGLRLAGALAAVSLAASVCILPVRADTSIAASAIAGLPGTETSTIVDGVTNASGRSDRLAVTVARVAGHNGVKTPKQDMDIWVGEVELRGRKAVWVELIDKYGEVVYDAEIKQNETHLLPDGRAIVVRALPEAGSQLAKVDQSRIPTDANLVVTRRVVQKDNQASTVEFFQEEPLSAAPPSRKDDSDTALVAVAHFGERVWAALSGFFTGAADNVRYAFRWIAETVVG